MEVSLHPVVSFTISNKSLLTYRANFSVSLPQGRVGVPRGVFCLNILVSENEHYD